MAHQDVLKHHDDMHRSRFDAEAALTAHDNGRKVSPKMWRQIRKEQADVRTRRHAVASRTLEYRTENCLNTACHKVK